MTGLSVIKKKISLQTHNLVFSSFLTSYHLAQDNRRKFIQLLKWFELDGNSGRESQQRYPGSSKLEFKGPKISLVA